MLVGASTSPFPLSLLALGGPPLEVSVPGEPVYAKLWGSRSHNTALSDSDYDFLVVYAADNTALLSLHPPGDGFTLQKPDVDGFEVGKFCRLLLKGNPAQIEMLFTERHQLTSCKWDVLRGEWRRFVSARALKQYLGYAEAQLHKLATGASLHSKGGSYNAKWAYHLLRVLGDASRIARGGGPVVWKEGMEQKFLMKVRAEEFNQDQVERLAHSRLDLIERAKPWPLPAEGDEKFLNDWLLWVRGLGPGV